MTVADEYLAQVGGVLDRLDEEQAISDVDEVLPECARETLALFAGLEPIIGITIKLGAGPAPGEAASEDVSWAALVALARRDVLAQQAAGVDQGLAADNLRLLGRIDALIGQWPSDSWDDAVRSRVRELVDARQRGALRGRELRASQPETDSKSWPTVGWLLRHPDDHWLHQAVQGVSDPDCKALIEGQIARLRPSYEAMFDLDLAAEEAAAEVICEMKIVDVSPGRWKEPVPAVVTAPVRGVELDQEISVRVVEDPDAQFNGTLVGLLPGERWRLCASKLEDGTMLPLDGTRRWAAASV